MVAGRGSGCSHIADHLALHNLLSHRDADGGAVRIERFLPISVIQFHVISIAAAPVSYTHLDVYKRQAMAYPVKI